MAYNLVLWLIIIIIDFPLIILCPFCMSVCLSVDTIPSPEIKSIVVTCDGVSLKWAGPVLAEGFDVLEYQLEVSQANTTIHYTNSNNTTTSLLISYDELEYGQWYNVSLSARYCGGLGRKTNGQFYTALGTW